eukprot:SAG31_NODE_242_length_19350_cov_3.043998_3_plen_119_part_00
MLTLFKASIGPGCLSVAYAASQAGLAVAVPGTMLIAGLAVYCMQLLVRVKQELAPQGVQTYGDIGACLAGQIGQRLVESFVVLQQLGTSSLGIGHLVAASILNNSLRECHRRNMLRLL